MSCAHSSSETEAWRLRQTPQGKLVPGDLELTQRTLSAPAKDEVLVEVCWLSVDPYMRTRMQSSGYDYLNRDGMGKWTSGSYLSAWGLGRVLEVGSEVGDKVASGDWVVGHLPVARHGLVRFSSERGALPPLVFGAQQTAPVDWLHARGMTGFTAWLAMCHYARPRASDTVLVTGGAGAVGSLAVQWALTSGARVLASAGSSAGREWLSSLGVTGVLDHGSPEVFAEQLRQLAPGGLDLHMEQLGGATFASAIDAVRSHGRVVLCGLVSQYNEAEPRRAPPNLQRLVSVGARLQPFVVPGHEAEHWGRFQQQAASPPASAFAAPLEVIDGLESWAEALCGLLVSGNRRGPGKRVIQLQAFNPVDVQRRR
ncbi:MDR family NADP-dependent oxidoreductase [Halomonas huangheensis]|uniref:Enoyl reductase (ER) domain-containing protein n=1 Tax=Halomonas huangheensis TaxID=1178482 RepID=W1NBY0_9GAMM|nr:NADP-dependent oxidoreductase [Halomonas huangheensis]ALM53677.1 hypothetical protein AR456_16405 [Halomonas huangheensis]ERL52415.1 hypothetical protein BJB45_10640 [Halomonas huangheensis]